MNTDPTIVPILLCGGSGTRLWPLSRSVYPKQLISLTNEHTMLQNTLLRVQKLIKDCQPIVICNEEYRFIVAEQIQETDFPKTKILLEPSGRNTAPAVTIAALNLQSQNNDPLLLILPADHVIKNIDALFDSIQAGIKLANQGYLVTFGVRPDKPETGYGYIQRGDVLSDGYCVKRFIEKPDLRTAQEYITAGDYLWNSGMFLFKTSVFLQAMHTHASDILDSCKEALKEMCVDLDFNRLGARFLATRSESIDFAVMEKADNIAVVPLLSEWSDVGSWDVLWQISQKDQEGNVLRGSVFVNDVTNSYIRSEKRLLAVLGLSNIAVIETADAVLVSNKENCQNIKALVSQLKDNQRDETENHNRVYRPWGYYESLNKSERYQVKHIVIRPGAKLSLQLHQHRAEHWVIIKGTAFVTCGDKQLTLIENESVYIPAKMQHRIENNEDNSLHLIEVQTGHYLGEDDIVRLDDVYGRAEPVT